uniref:Uncharacterized protein n=1 Tax=Romanomermis culicivorax TaxID=13658 RepID=A0A915HGB5_ROMCU
MTLSLISPYQLPYGRLTWTLHPGQRVGEIKLHHTLSVENHWYWQYPKGPFILQASESTYAIMRVSAYANEIIKKCARKSASQMLSLEQREHLEQKREH